MNAGRVLQAALALLILLLAGCGDDPGHPYFPLDEDAAWHYRVIERTTRATTEREFSQTALGARRFGDERVPARRTSDGTVYYYRLDEDGVKRVAKRLVVELEPQPDFPERLVLPSDAEPGAQWQNTTHPYVLERLVSDGVDMKRTYSVPMNYTVEAVDETVTVPAGTFEGCIRVTGEADLQMYVDGPSGLSTIPLRMEEWYAPGVGLVRLVRTEDVESDLMAGGQIEMELVAFERP